MLDIQITDDLKITSDEDNFILSKAQRDKNNIISRWRDFEWYDELDSLIESVLKRGIRSQEAKTPQELINMLDELKTKYLAIKNELK